MVVPHSLIMETCMKRDEDYNVKMFAKYKEAVAHYCTVTVLPSLKVCSIATTGVFAAESLARVVVSCRVAFQILFL